MRHQPESLSQPTLQPTSSCNSSNKNGAQSFVPRTQSFNIDVKTEEIVSDLLGNINLKKSDVSSKKGSATSELLGENNQDSLSIDIDEELARLDLETVDEFRSSSAGTFNQDERERIKVFSKEYGNTGANFIDEIVEETFLATCDNINEESENKLNQFTSNESSGGEASGNVVPKKHENDKFGLSHNNTDSPSNIKTQTLLFLSDKSYDKLSQSRSSDIPNNGSQVKEMDRSKVQVNGTTMQPGPSQRPGAGTRSEGEIPGKIITFL